MSRLKETCDDYLGFQFAFRSTISSHLSGIGLHYTHSTQGCGKISLIFFFGNYSMSAIHTLQFESEAKPWSMVLGCSCARSRSQTRSTHTEHHHALTAHTYTYTHKYTHTYTHTHKHTYIHTHKHTHTNTHLHAHTRTLTHTDTKSMCLQEEMPTY